MQRGFLTTAGLKEVNFDFFFLTRGGAFGASAKSNVFGRYDREGDEELEEEVEAEAEIASG